MYHVDLDPPAKPGVCDRCGGELYQRDDDREDTIRARLAVYDKSTAPLTAFYRERGLLRDVEGTGTTAEVLQRVLAQVEPRH
jgi:adenylate kinase